jgi:thiamine biosynthesis lipoprotein
MDPRRTAVPARLVLILLALLATRVPARAAGRPGGGNRAAAATGPRLTRSTRVLDGVLTVAAASRGIVMDTTRTSTALDLTCQEAEQLTAVFAPEAGVGELARLNRAAAGERFPCSVDLFAALEAATALAAETEGAYDPTDGPLRRAWERGARPDAGDLSAARLLVGWRMLALDPGTRTARFARPGMEVALGAIARGTVLEHAAAALRQRGIARARLELGGDVLAFTSHEPWSVAVPGPHGGDRVVVTLIVSNAAVATARSDGEGSRRVLDPRTGQRVPGEVSVTVVERSAVRARALAEALLVMGRDGASAYAGAHPGAGVLWLEPLGGDVRAWAWNLGRVAPEPDVRIEWMTEP